MRMMEALAIGGWQRGWKRTMMRIEQHDIRAVIQLAIDHELIDIPLTDALFRIVNLWGHSLPFRIDNHHDPLTLPDDQVGLRPKTARFSFEQAVAMTALRDDTQTAASQGAGQ